MKNLTLLFLSFILITTGCQQEPTPAPSPNPTTQSTMTPWEASLVGQWKLKRSEMRGMGFQPALGDSTMTYTNYYNYNNSQLELKATPYTSSGSVQYYEGRWGFQDAGPTYDFGWNSASSTIYTIGLGNNFTVHYLSFAPDSLVLDLGGATRYFYNKSNTPPTLNNIESQLIGGTWQLVSTTYSGGSPTAPTNPTYKTFFNNWGSGGYQGRDSIYYSATSNYTNPISWEVLFPNRTIPIFANSLGFYYKITNLTATALTLEHIGQPSVNSNIDITYIYSR